MPTGRKSLGTKESRRPHSSWPSTCPSVDRRKNIEPHLGCPTPTHPKQVFSMASLAASLASASQAGGALVSKRHQAGHVSEGSEGSDSNLPPDLAETHRVIQMCRFAAAKSKRSEKCE